MKTIGKRRPAKGSISSMSSLHELAVALRGDKPFHPRGVFRFKSHEEKEAWNLKNMAR